jgi:predicted RNase H-like HicB family nuclease
MSIKYEVIIYWSKEDNTFIAEMPELPGCMADGETYEKALKNIEVVSEEWIETAKEVRRAESFHQKKRKSKYRLEELVSKIAPENLYGEIDFGPPVGKEKFWE